MTSPPNIKVTVLLPRELWSRLAVAAAHCGVSRAELVRQRLERAVRPVTSIDNPKENV
jgi:hypothetical protein